ncbi:MAG: DUF6089 family protein [Chitinophagales bacterium]|nr:OmpA family protein [Bacteroidota bacterium]MBK8489204.1 OmpA family protein [Bacteroidota bacterium]
MLRTIKISGFLFLFLMQVQLLFSQQNIYNWRFAVSGGAMMYYGDINTEMDFDDFNYPAIGIEFGKNISTSLSWRLKYSNGKISANDLMFDNSTLNLSSSNFERGLNFKTDIHDLSLQFVFSTDNNAIFYNRSFISPYIFAGIGHTYFEVYSDLYFNDSMRYYYYNEGIFDEPEGGNAQSIMQDGIFETNVSDLQTEGVNYSKYVWNIPVGIGFKFRIAERITANLEGTYTFYFTDYLDDISGKYPAESLVPYATNPTGSSAEYRGNADGKYDNTFLISFSIAYSFGNKKSDFELYPIQAARYDYLTQVNPDSIYTDSIITMYDSLTVDSTITSYMYKVDSTFTGDSVLAQEIRFYNLDTLSWDTLSQLVKYDSTFYNPVYRIDTLFSEADSNSTDSLFVRTAIGFDSVIVDSTASIITLDSIMYSYIPVTDTVFKSDGKYAYTTTVLIPEMVLDSMIIDSIQTPYSYKKTILIYDTIRIAQFIADDYKMPQQQYSDSTNQDMNQNKMNTDSNSQAIEDDKEQQSKLSTSTANDISETSKVAAEETAAVLATESKSSKNSASPAESTVVKVNDNDAAIMKSLNEIKFLIVGGALVSGLTGNKSSKKQDAANTEIDSATLKQIDSLIVEMQKLTEASQFSDSIKTDTTIIYKEKGISDSDYPTYIPATSKGYDYTQQNTLILFKLLEEITALKSEVSEMKNQLLNPQKPDTVVMEKTITEKGEPATQIIYYKTGKTAPDQNDLKALKAILAFAKANETSKIKISGFADKTGSSAGNKSITQKRANAVKQYFIDQGIATSRITAIGYGDEFSPAGANAQYRKVEVEVLK